MAAWASPTARPATSAPSDSLHTAYQKANAISAPRARNSRRVLILFSGPYQRPDGIAAFLARLGFESVLVDNDAANGGDNTHDLRNDAFYADLMRRCHSGEYIAVFAAPPCSTFSVARLFPSKDGKPAPIPVRDRDHVTGLPHLPPSSRRSFTATA